MIVKTYYTGGHMDVFDTDHMTEALPQKGNLLTNYSIDLADREGEAIWLSCYYYETTEEYKNTVGPKGLPVARRRDGWSFLLVDSEDMKTLDRLTVDDEVLVARIGEELADVGAVRRAFEAAGEIIPMVQTAHRFAFSQLKDRPGADAVHEACERIGVSHHLYDSIVKLAVADR